MKKSKVGIIGATGYVGVELLNLLEHQSDIEVSFLSSSSSIGETLYEKIKPFSNIKNQEFFPADLAIEEDLDYVFFATQHNFSMDIVPSLLRKKIKVIDLSADFRFSDPNLWLQAYEDQHRAPELLKKSVYGLPELERDKIKNADLVAVPGCYPTASILGIIPVLNHIEKNSQIILDVKSGISGAGRQTVENGMSDEIQDNFKAYSPDFHRHQTEILHFLEKQLGASPEIIFTPHLIPIFRGEYVTCYLKIKDKEANFQEIYKNFYQKEKFVRVLSKGTVPEIKKVQHTNFCDISVFKKENILTVHVAIDNLLKGAASQAIQCLNLMSGVSEDSGLNLL
tara:strand:- start:1116 stop:2132 length:1017 start_codon:yes stop_codon:yes gene_type:complete